MTYPQSAGSCRMSTQMENPIIEIWHCWQLVAVSHRCLHNQ
jgi:hypothetical protein